MIWLSVQQGINLFTYRLLFIVLLVPPFLIFELGIGLFLSTIFVFFRDLKHIYTVFLTLWQYTTPIFYNIKRLSEDPNSFTFTVIKLNPMFHFVEYFRDCVYRGATGIDSLGKNVGPYLPLWSTYGILWLCAGISLVIGCLFYFLLKNKIITKI